MPDGARLALALWLPVVSPPHAPGDPTTDGTTPGSADMRGAGGGSGGSGGDPVDAESPPQPPRDAPADAAPLRCGAVLEYLPYRKADWTVPRDEPRHAYVASHGFAVVRADIRGSGDSDGLIVDEYSEVELTDGEVRSGCPSRRCVHVLHCPGRPVV